MRFTRKKRYEKILLNLKLARLTENYIIWNSIYKFDIFRT